MKRKNISLATASAHQLDQSGLCDCRHQSDSAHICHAVCATHSVSRANLPRLSRNSALPPWWKCMGGGELDDSFSLKTMTLQPSSLTVMERRSPTLKVNAHRLFSWLWFREPDRQNRGITRHDQGRHRPAIMTQCTANTICTLRNFLWEILELEFPLE